MTKPHIDGRVGLVLLVAVCLALAGSVCAQDNAAADAERVIRALEIDAGDSVAEIGAGSGALTIAIAQRVGPHGRVYTSELGENRVRDLRQAVERGHLPQVTVIDGSATDTNLRDECCDAVFMRLVYHHFADPAAMNASLFRSLKPGGRLAIIEFPPDGAEASNPEDRDEGKQHGVTAETVTAELKQAGFEIVSVDNSSRNFMVLARRPE